MVTDFHHWLNAIEFFPSNFSGFSILSLEVRIASLRGSLSVWARVSASATPFATSLATIRVSTCGVGPGFHGPGGEGSLNSRLGGLGGDGGEGDRRGGGFDAGGPPPVPPAVNGPCSGGAIAHLGGVFGIARGLCLRVPMLRGLRKARRVASWFLMLVGLGDAVGLSSLGICRGDGLVGVRGRDTAVATRINSSCALANCCSSPAMRARSSSLWCSSVSTFC